MVDERLYITPKPNTIVSSVDDRPFDPNKPTINRILWDNYEWLEEMDAKGKARSCVLDNVQRTLLCNTVYLGYDGFECPNCGNWNFVFRHCHSRFCTSCGVKTQKILAAKAETMCLDVPHRHIVFTIPEEYRLWFRKDRKALDLLFIAARNTICKVVNENLYRKLKRKQNKTGKYQNDKDNTYLFRNYKNKKEFGMIATIHTFGRALNWNPHIHALVAEAIYDPNTDSYKNFNHFDFVSLRKTWQYEVNRLMVNFFGKEFKKQVNYNYKEHDNGFYVYAKTNKYDDDNSYNKNYTKNIKGCVNYMMRYASRPAMAESRLISYDKETKMVKWYYDDHKTEERIIVEEPGLDLFKKMIIHIPDTNFKTVRYYGFYNNKKQKLLDKIHTLIGTARHKPKVDRKLSLKEKLNRLKYRTHVCDTFNRDILKCSCGTIMEYYISYNPLERRPNDRKYREECIDEMREMWVSRASPPKRS